MSSAAGESSVVAAVVWGQSTNTVTYTDSQPTTDLTAASHEIVVLDGVRQDVVIPATSAIQGTGTVRSLSIANGGIVAPGHSPGRLTVIQTLTLASGSTYQSQLRDVQEGGYDQIQVSDPSRTTGQDANITGAILDISFYDGWDITVGDQFMIINNLQPNSQAINGTFVNLAEGTQFTVESEGVVITFSITYVGGDGNDIVLTALNTGTDPTPPNTGVARLIMANPVTVAALGVVTVTVLVLLATRYRRTV